MEVWRSGTGKKDEWRCEMMNGIVEMIGGGEGKHCERDCRGLNLKLDIEVGGYQAKDCTGRKWEFV